jgi:hypothetical protein
MTYSIFALTLAAAGAGPAFANTGTLDIGALTPQATGSRTAMEIMNTGAAARTQGGEKPKPAQPQSSPRQAGEHTGGYTGTNRQ